MHLFADVAVLEVDGDDIAVWFYLDSSADCQLGGVELYLDSSADYYQQGGAELYPYWPADCQQGGVELYPAHYQQGGVELYPDCSAAQVFPA